MPYFDEFIHVYGWNMRILWSPLKIWTPKYFTTANFRHPVSKSWLKQVGWWRRWQCSLLRAWLCLLTTQQPLRINPNNPYENYIIKWILIILSNSQKNRRFWSSLCLSSRLTLFMLRLLSSKEMHKIAEKFENLLNPMFVCIRKRLMSSIRWDPICPGVSVIFQLFSHHFVWIHQIGHHSTRVNVWPTQETHLFFKWNL